MPFRRGHVRLHFHTFWCALCLSLLRLQCTDIITFESVIFSMRFSVYIKKFIVSSGNNLFYIQIHHFTQQTMLNLRWITRYNILNQTLNLSGVVTTTPLVADVTINSLVAWRLSFLFCTDCTNGKSKFIMVPVHKMEISRPYHKI